MSSYAVVVIESVTPVDGEPDTLELREHMREFDTFAAAMLGMAQAHHFMLEGWRSMTIIHVEDLCMVMEGTVPILEDDP